MQRRIAVLVFALLIAPATASQAALSYTVDPNGWPAGWYSAAVANMQTVVNMHNAYGDFGNGNIFVYYNAGIPTAQANYNGSIGVGGTYPNVRVLLHEAAHWLGTGTYSANWGGPRPHALVSNSTARAVLSGDGVHFWPYGENYDNESSPINEARHVAVVYALRQDFGVGSTASPSAAQVVTLTASDALGTSGFNYASTWSDSHFVQPGTAYSTGNFTLRTPLDSNNPGGTTPGFTFAGNSLINNANGVNGGLLFGRRTSSVLTFKNLILNGGYVRLPAGPAIVPARRKVTPRSPKTIDAQGNVKIQPISAAGLTDQDRPLRVDAERRRHVRRGNTTINSGVRAWLRLRRWPVTPSTALAAAQSSTAEPAERP
jgi:hypothetical protein